MIGAKYPAEQLERMARDFADDSDITDAGKLVEAGWQSLRIAALDPNAAQRQVDDMRSAFFAGAGHLYFAIITILVESAEPQAKRFQHMAAIETELRAFIADFELRRLPPQGSG